MPVNIRGMVQYKNGVVNIGPFDQVIQSMEKWEGVIDVLFLSLSKKISNHLLNKVKKYFISTKNMIRKTIYVHRDRR